MRHAGVCHAMADSVAGVQDNVISRLPEWTHVRERWRSAREGEVMATFTRSDDLQGAEFAGANLRGARFRRADLPGVVMRAVDVRGRTSTHRGSSTARASCASTAWT
jgi:hypothetical protein